LGNNTGSGFGVGVGVGCDLFTMGKYTDPAEATLTPTARRASNNTKTNIIFFIFSSNSPVMGMFVYD
jgi:hypothetical protein